MEYVQAMPVSGSVHVSAHADAAQASDSRVKRSFMVSSGEFRVASFEWRVASGNDVDWLFYRRGAEVSQRMQRNVLPFVPTEKIIGFIVLAIVFVGIFVSHKVHKVHEDFIDLPISW